MKANVFGNIYPYLLSIFSDAGDLQIRQELPHTITEWVASAVCSNENSGLGVSVPATIKAFQPFFASFSLPYSIVRGERVSIKVTVFNYLKDCIVVSNLNFITEYLKLNKQIKIIRFGCFSFILKVYICFVGQASTRQ